MLVGLDVDGVVADFLGPFLRFVERRIGCAPIAPETIVDLSYKDHPVITEAVLEQSLAALAEEPDFFDRLVPLLEPAEWRALDALSRERRLVFITHRQASEGRDVQRLTRDWLLRHGVWDPIVHCTADYKSKLVSDLGVEIFVDDRPENCLDVAEKTRAAVYMPRRRYNAFFDHPKVTTFDRFGELLDYLR
jgi:5' nucleotidase, deoxy (Pyrimidine), cytosolic type C protein (NT5C)